MLFKWSVRIMVEIEVQSGNSISNTTYHYTTYQISASDPCQAGEEAEKRAWKSVFMALAVVVVRIDCKESEKADLWKACNDLEAGVSDEV